jgi:nitrate/nitrite transport system substrate-binding protein
MTKPTDQTPRRGLSRRQILKATAVTAALLAAARLNFPAGAFAQGAGPEVKAAKLGFIALSDASPLFVAKDKGLFAKHGMPDVDVQKQASWGTTRDNLVLGSEGNGIDGAHILTPMPYLISSGKVTQNNQPTPMYILARLNLDAQCISVAKEYADLKVGVDAAPLKAVFEQKKAAGKSPRLRDLPVGTHDLWIRYWLCPRIIPTRTSEPSWCRRRMSRQQKVAPVTSALAGPGTQLIHQDIGYTAVNTGKSAFPRNHSACAAWVDRIEGCDDPHGSHGGAAMGRQGREQGRTCDHHGQAAVDQLSGRRHSRSHQGQVRLWHRQGGRKQPARHEVLARLRLLSVPEP